MKQLLVIAIALTSVNAFATRARMTALQNSPHLVDTQSIYNRPTDIFAIGSDFATIESGVTGTVAAPAAANRNAEGMIVRTMGDAKLGVALGHQSMNSLRSQLMAAPVIGQQNPIEFTYGMKNGDMNLAGTLVYSNYNDKLGAGATLVKESSTALRLGAAAGAWDATLSLGLVNTAQNGTGEKFAGSSDMNFFGSYTMADLWWFAKLATSVGKTESAAGVETGKVTNMNWTLGVSHANKKDGNELFYSIALASTDAKTAGTPDTKSTSLSLPITVGVEVDAASWLTVRGSVSQSTFIHNTKNEAAPASEFAPGANSTTVAVGAGLKLNKLTLDGTLLQTGTVAGNGGQSVDATNLLAQVGATYWF